MTAATTFTTRTQPTTSDPSAAERDAEFALTERRLAERRSGHTDLRALRVERREELRRIQDRQWAEFAGAAS